MIKTSEIEAICSEIADINVDFERVFDSYLSAFPNARRRFLRDLLKHFSEIHLDLCLETIAQKTKIPIKRTPLPKTETARCTYFYTPLGRLFANFKCSKDSQDFEYDSIVIVDGIPVDFEISILGVNGSNGKNKVDTRRRLTQDYCQKKLLPLQELFDSDIAYVFISPSDAYRILNNPSRRDATAFKENNGLLAQLPFTKEAFKSGVCRIAKEKNMHYFEKERGKGIH